MGFHFRFRKSFRIMPGVKGTISRRGASINFHSGLVSKSFGTRRNTTTVDVPGVHGAFWRSEHGHGHHAHGRASAEQRQWEHEQGKLHRRAHLVHGLMALSALILAGRLFLPALFERCVRHGAALPLLIVVIVVPWVAIAYGSKHVGMLRSPLALIACVVLAWVQWKAYGALIASEMVCR
jgi:hypothetical protein